MRHGSLIVILTGMFLQACGGREGVVSTYSIRDSVGIPIVENKEPAWEPDGRWQVDDHPVFDVSEQRDAELFGLASPLALPDGRVVVFNGGSCQVRFYSEAGEHLGSSGRCGDGPGEFGQYARLALWSGDSLLVNEFPGRLTILDREGGLGRTARIPSRGDVPVLRLTGVMPDGSMVVSGLRDPGVPASTGIGIAELWLGVSHPLVDSVRLLGTYPGPVYQYTELQGRMGRGILPFSSSSKLAVGSEGVFVGLPDRNEIREIRPTGGVSRIVRRPLDPVQVVQADIDWLIARRLAEVEGPENQRLVRQAFRDLRHAEEMPAFGVPVWTSGSEAGGPDLIQGIEGDLWVFDYYRPGEYRNRFSVFSREGVWLGSVDLPHRFEPSQIGSDFLVGVWTDDLGFRHVWRLGLTKP